MDFLTILEGHVHAAAEALMAGGEIPTMPRRIGVERSHGDDRGDFACVFAAAPEPRPGAGPRSLAEKLVSCLSGNADLADVQAASPGFLNLTLSAAAWTRMLAGLLAQGENYGRAMWGEGRSVGIGFMPVGKAVAIPDASPRAAVVGATLANMLDFKGFRARRSVELNRESDLTVRLATPLPLLGEEMGLSLAELIAAIGADAVRFGILMQRTGRPVALDAVLLSDLSIANPLFQVQYAHARCCALLEKGALFSPQTIGSDLWRGSSFLEKDSRLILRQLALYPRQSDLATRMGEPFWLVRYLLDLSRLLHAQYNRSLTAPHLRFIRDDDRLLTGARLALVRGVETVLKSGLALLGVEAPKEIR